MFLPVIELSGVGRVQPPVHFSTPPAYSQKLPWGVRLNPPDQRSVTQCILLSACIQRFPTLLSFRMIRSSEATTVVWIIYLFILILRMFYLCTSMPSSSSFFSSSSVGCADDEVLTRLFQTSFLFVFWSLS